MDLNFVLEIFKQRPTIKNKELTEILGVSMNTVATYVRQLKTSGKIATYTKRHSFGSGHWAVVRTVKVLN